MTQNTKDSNRHKVEKFVNEAPNHNYIIDDDQLAICRLSLRGQEKESIQECVQLGMSQKDMFSLMQDLGFYCALPSDPTETYFKCQRI